MATTQMGSEFIFLVIFLWYHNMDSILGFQQLKELLYIKKVIKKHVITTKSKIFVMIVFNTNV